MSLPLFVLLSSIPPLQVVVEDQALGEPETVIIQFSHILKKVSKKVAIKLILAVAT
jgi:hypothetical protein